MFLRPLVMILCFIEVLGKGVKKEGGGYKKKIVTFSRILHYVCAQKAFASTKLVYIDIKIEKMSKIQIFVGNL